MFRQKITIFFHIKPDTHRYVKWAIPSLLNQTRRSNPLVYKWLSAQMPRQSTVEPWLYPFKHDQAVGACVQINTIQT